MGRLKIINHFLSDLAPLLPRLLMSLIVLIFALITISCGGGKKSGTPPAEGNAILPSATKLDPPSLTFPPTADHPSNTSSLNITGRCTPGPGAKVYLGGDENQQTSCSSSGDFSFVVQKTNDGIFNYTLREESLIHHPSENSSLVWKRSTALPATPTLTNPSSYPFTTNTSNTTLTGTCTAGLTVTFIEGSNTQTSTCSNSGTFSFTISKSSDGTYTFSIYQIDAYGNQSHSLDTSWTRNATPPSAPVIQNPVANPYTATDTAITLSGTCQSGSNVNLSGQTTGSVLCSGGTFSFDLSESSTGTYNYSLVAVSSSNVSSSTVSFQWIRSASVPTTPILTSPASSPLIDNSSSLTIAGSCTDGLTVHLTGSDAQTATCASSSFSFSVTKSTDGTYNFSVYQDNAGVNSGAVGVTWTRDTLPPTGLAITSPLISPYYSSSTSLLIGGTCETGATVNLTGDTTSTTTCTSSSFTFNISKSTDATYNFSVSQTDSANNTSASVTLQWILDTAVPAAPTMTSPASSPFTSNGNSITVAGGCENGATIYLTGAATQSVSCSSNAYSFTVSKTTDGTYSFSTTQTDLAGNISTSTSKQWIRDTAAPAAPTVTNPASNPLTSNGNSLTLSGACETGATVNYSGAASGSTTCASGAYSFSFSKAVDGTYVVSITQTDAATNTSAATSFTWNRLSSIPSTPVITSPATSPYYSKLYTLTLAGTCTTGNTVQLSGAESQSTTCSSNAFSFALSQSTNNTFNYSVVQINGASISSGAANFTWVVDTVAPNKPVVTSPATASVTNSNNSLTISGTCEANATVQYSGSASGTTSCTAGSSFSFTVNKTTDGTYTFSILQVDLAGNNSGTTTITWIRDTLAPSAPTLTQPNLNPYTSGDTTLAIGGACEVGATVTLAGATTGSMTCTALGTYSFSTTKTTDGNYNYTVTQADIAGNTSSSLNFQWVRDTTIPFTPVQVSPTNQTHYSNTSTVTISVTCQTGLTPDAIVHLNGVLAGEVTNPAGLLDQDCVTSPVSYTIQRTTDGTYDLTINQENPNNNNASADMTFTWIRDTVAPAAPTITSPSASPYTGPGNITLAGACENNATVSVSGDATQNQTCSGGAYSFSIIKSTDATYTFNVSQTDLAGNTSSATTQIWTRNSNSLPPPTITSPAANPVANNNSTLTISGDCLTDYLVTLGGNVVAGDVSIPSNSLTQICDPSGTYSFEINKTTDGIYNFNVVESYNGATSAATNLTWTRDTTPPTITLSTTPNNPNLVTSATFVFSANETATFQCQLGAGAFQSCTSPKTFTGLTNGATSFSVIATDTVGNTSSTTTFNWTQAAYNAVAIYHLNAGLGTALNDSGLFTTTGSFNNNLTATGGPSANTSFKFPTSSPRSYNMGSGKYFSVANNASFGSVSKSMTLEGMFYFGGLTSTAGQYYTLMSSSGGSAPNLGWELRLEKQSGSCTKWKLKFVASLDGSTQSTLTSTSCITVSTGKWYYVVLTWNSGTVNFYLSSSGVLNRGSGVIGTAGTSTLFVPNAPFKIGAGPTTGTGSAIWITNGIVDEFRISNTVRTPAYPTGEYTAD